jgi:hypothetical protein
MEQTLSKIKSEQFNKQPILETSVQISEDKKWIVCKTIITDIKSVNYYKKVIGIEI